MPEYEAQIRVQMSGFDLPEDAVAMSNELAQRMHDLLTEFTATYDIDPGHVVVSAVPVVAYDPATGDET